MKIAAIFSNVEYTEVPFGHLHQLENVGISNVIILLNEDEYKKANETKYAIFDDTEPKTVIEHYQTQSDKLKIEVINTGVATTIEEKLDFYLKHATERYGLNLFLTKEHIPWVTEELSAKIPEIETTEYSFMPFFKQSNRKQLPSFQSPCSSEQAIKLLQQESSPCLCYKMSKVDVLHYQWLFNIFVELITLEIKFHKEKNAEFYPQLSRLINAYNKNITSLEMAEENFIKTHQKMYATLDEPDFITRWQHDKNLKIKTDREDNFPKIIGKLVTCYNKMVSQENLDNSLNNRDEADTNEDYLQKDFIEHIEGKPFGF